MARFQIAMVLLCSMVYLAHATKPLFDPNKCPNGCQVDANQCPENAQCKPLDTSGNCGFCICDDGFSVKGNKCVGIKGYTTTTTSTTTTPTTTTSTTTVTTTAAITTTTTAAPQTTTTTVPTTTGTTTQGPPPTPEALNCGDYDCAAAPPPSSNDPLVVQSSLVTPGSGSCKRQLLVPSRPCNLKGGGACYGSYCLTVSPGNDYCICPYYRVDRQCAVDKPGKCSAGTGQLPAGNSKLQNRRLRNQADKDNGSIYGRHFAPDVNTCIELCQWSQGACRSVNFGQIGGANVCEMLSIAASEKNPLLAPWIEKADGWQYVQVGQAN